MVEPDQSCVPYRRKGLYFLLTIPILALHVAVTVFLGTVHPVLAAAMVLLYGAMCFFQSYCCAHQDCPYMGGFCPAVEGIMPAAYIAKWRFRKGVGNRTKRRFEVNATIASLAWLGLIVLPLPWLWGLGLVWSAGYVAIHVVYTVSFGALICPVCAIRRTCPGGRASEAVRRRFRSARP